MKDMRGGDRARWICDALHSIMLMRRIIMSPPRAVEAQCGHKCVSLLMLGFVCKAVHVCVWYMTKAASLTFQKWFCLATLTSLLCIHFNRCS